MSTEAIQHLEESPELAPLIAEYGVLVIEPADDPFRRFIVSIINQQLSSESASAIRERVFERYEITPEALAGADEAGLRDAGLSRQKIEYIKNIASTHLESEFGPARFEGMDDEAVIEDLTRIRGVGAWTAKMYLMFCLGREDVFPVEDLGIRKGMRALYGDELSRDAMLERASEWRPYRSYAARYVWKAQGG